MPKNKSGKVTIINRGPRVTLEQTKNIIQKIPVLNGMFTRLHASFDNSKEPNAFEEPDEAQATMALTYMSRLSSGLWGGVEKKYAEPEEHHEHKGHEQSVGSVSQTLGDNGIIGDLNTRSVGSASAEGVSKLMKRRRIALSLATLASKPDRLETIVNEGAIGAIIELSSISDPIVLKSCASAFSLLAKEPSLRKKMHDGGALQAILILSMTQNTLVRTECIKALSNLMCEDGYESKSVRDGLPYTLMKIVDMSDNIEPVLTCLLNLT
jgi:hypothetical protein